MPNIDYRVKAGDTLFEIAMRHDVRVATLAQLNDISDIDRIWAGQILKIPSQGKPVKVRSASDQHPHLQKSFPFEGAQQIGSIGRVSHDAGVNLHEQPEPFSSVTKRLPFNTRVFVSCQLPGDWYFVTVEGGYLGYVYKKFVSINPADPEATLHKIKHDEGALAIVRQHYKRDAIKWGQDERYFANVLVEANRGTGLRGIYKPYEGADWDTTKTRENYVIWIPSLSFARSLRGRVGSGSISYEVWQLAKKTALGIAEFSLGQAAFSAGLLHGALESIWDLLTGIFDLLEMIWKIVKSVLTAEFFSDLASLVENIKSLKPGELVDAGLKGLLDRWNQPDLLRRWHFRGWLVGYAIAEIVVAIVSAGAAIVKWAGKAGKLSKLLTKFPKVVKLAEKTQHAAKTVKNTSKQKLQKWLARYSDEAAAAKKPVKGFLRLRSDYDEHVIKRDFSVKRKKGIGGAHNMAEFMKYAHELNILRKIPHPKLKGVYRIEYQIQALDKAGNPTKQWGAHIFEKTVYDPKHISDDLFMTWGRQAAAEAQAAGRLTREWEGVTPDGIKMRGYLDDSGAVRSFFIDF